MSAHTSRLDTRTLVGVVLGLTLAACGGETELPERGAALDEVFRADRRIALEQDEDDPVVDVSAVTVLSDGGLLVVDQPAGRVRRFDDDGSRDGVVGRPGEGPGELRQPSSTAAGPEDTLFVVQRGGPRLTVYGPDGPPARAFEVPGSYGHWVTAVGESVRTFGEPPPSWTGAVPPSPGEVEGGSDEEQMRRWLTSFTIVTGLATVGDSLVVVQHGRHDPTPEQAYRVRHEWIDVYRLDGTKLYEEIPLEEPVVAGGDRLYTLGEEPPGPWTIHAYEWVEQMR